MRPRGAVGSGRHPAVSSSHLTAASPSSHAFTRRPMLSTDSLERQLLDALPVTIHVLDLDGRLTSVHQPAARLSDDGTTPALSADTLRGTSLWDVAGGAFVRDQVEHAMRELRSGRTRVARWELTRTTDDRRVMLAQMTPLHDES